ISGPVATFAVQSLHQHPVVRGEVVGLKWRCLVGARGVLNQGHAPPLLTSGLKISYQHKCDGACLGCRGTPGPRAVRPAPRPGARATGPTSRARTAPRGAPI